MKKEQGHLVIWIAYVVAVITFALPVLFVKQTVTTDIEVIDGAIELILWIILGATAIFGAIIAVIMTLSYKNGSDTTKKMIMLVFGIIALILGVLQLSNLFGSTPNPVWMTVVTSVGFLGTAALNYTVIKDIK